MLENCKTMLDWDEAYESPVKRESVFCPNCGEAFKDFDVYSDGPKNKSNLYECQKCDQVVLIWFRDCEDWKSHLKLKQIKPSLYVILGLSVGFLLGLQLLLWGLF